MDVNALAYVDRGLLGCRYGSSRPHHDIPLMVELYLSGKLMLDELVTEQRPLEGFREIVEDMEAGKLARGVLTFSDSGTTGGRRRATERVTAARWARMCPVTVGRRYDGASDRRWSRTVVDVLRAAADVNADVEAYVEPATASSPRRVTDLRRVGPGRRRRGRVPGRPGGGPRLGGLPLCCRAPSTTWWATPPPPAWGPSPPASTPAWDEAEVASILDRTRPA